MKLNNKESLKSNRRNLRNNMTSAEIALWLMIRNRQLNGTRFLRQYSIGMYIVDFYCPKYHLAIELDGEYHFNEKSIQSDIQRTNFLQSKVVRVLRFENFEVIDYPQRTLNEILKYLYTDELPENLVQQ